MSLFLKHEWFLFLFFYCYCVQTYDSNWSVGFHIKDQSSGKSFIPRAVIQLALTQCNFRYRPITYFK